MYSIGIDAAKGKSTVCILSETGEVILPPKDYKHDSEGLSSLYETIEKLTKGKESRAVMEATGIYHWPIFLFLKEKGFFVSIINPLKMKSFVKDHNFRGVKTDKHDSKLIALYGCERWYSLADHRIEDDVYGKLRRLSRSYSSFQKPKIHLKQALDAQLEKSMPGIKEVFFDDMKLYDFVLRYVHFEKIRKLSKKKFMDNFDLWAKKKGYRFVSSTPAKIYELALTAIPTIPSDDSAKLIQESLISSLKSIEEGINTILARMNELASSLPEYEILRKIPGAGEALTPLLIAEIGDIRNYHDKKSLVSTAGIDVPPYESGKLHGSKRVITKKGNGHLRRHLYLLVKLIYMSRSQSDPAIHDFMMRKSAEGKLYKQVLVAGMRKFLHIYYARIKEEYKRLGIWKIER